MKLKIGGYDVNITAKYEYSDKANKYDTQHFLNEISIFLREAASSYAKDGCCLSKHANEMSEGIYNVLQAAGLYK